MTHINQVLELTVIPLKKTAAALWTSLKRILLQAASGACGAESLVAPHLFPIVPPLATSLSFLFFSSLLSDPSSGRPCRGRGRLDVTYIYGRGWRKSLSRVQLTIATAINISLLSLSYDEAHLVRQSSFMRGTNEPQLVPFFPASLGPTSAKDPLG